MDTRGWAAPPRYTIWKFIPSLLGRNLSHPHWYEHTYGVYIKFKSKCGPINSQAPTTPCLQLIPIKSWPNYQSHCHHNTETHTLIYFWKMLWCLGFPTVSIFDWNRFKGQGRRIFDRSESWIETTCRPGTHIKHQSGFILLHPHTQHHRRAAQKSSSKAGAPPAHST